MYKKKLNSLVILIPSYNEANNFKYLLKKIKNKYNILVIDDNSSDETKKILKKNKIPFLNNNRNLGYERSILKGIKYLKNKKYRFILTMDADGQHKIKYIEKFFSKINNSKYDIIIGSRIEKNRLIENLISLVSEKKYQLKDPLSGFKIYRKNIFRKINLDKVKNYFLVDLIIDFFNKDIKILDIDIHTNKRKDKPRIGNIFKSNIKMLKIFFKLVY